MTTLSRISIPVLRFLAASTIALGLVPLQTEAQERTDCAPHYQREPGSKMPAHFKALNLSQEQQEKFRAIEATHQDIIRKNFELLKTNRTTERELVESTSFDEQKAQKLAAQDAKIMEDNHLATLRFRHEIYQILTPEQRAKFDAMHQQRAGAHQP